MEGFYNAVQGTIEYLIGSIQWTAGIMSQAGPIGVLIWAALAIALVWLVRRSMSSQE